MSLENALRNLVLELESSDDILRDIGIVRATLFSLSPMSHNPVDNIRWVSIDSITPNNYNPNSVAPREMQLLYISIDKDGYTQPIVTYYDSTNNKYIIVDGFHRYYVSKTQKDIYDRNSGLVPIVVIEKTLAERMASTVRHNRARGKHSVQGMSELVFKMLSEGASDSDICNSLGMEPEELLRLKHITGFSKLFRNHEYGKSWASEHEIKARFGNEKSSG